MAPSGGLPRCYFCTMQITRRNLSTATCEECKQIACIRCSPCIGRCYVCYCQKPQTFEIATMSSNDGAVVLDDKGEQCSGCKRHVAQGSMVTCASTKERKAGCLWDKDGRICKDCAAIRGSGEHERVYCLRCHKSLFGEYCTDSEEDE